MLLCVCNWLIFERVNLVVKCIDKYLCFKKSKENVNFLDKF